MRYLVLLLSMLLLTIWPKLATAQRIDSNRANWNVHVERQVSLRDVNDGRGMDQVRRGYNDEQGDHLRDDPLTNGALIGAAAGAGFGVVVIIGAAGGIGDRDATTKDMVIAGAIGAAIGATVGMLIDAVIKD